MAPELHHLRQGSGPRLLLLHGLGGSVVLWNPVLDLLAAEREVIAVDMPGFGRSAAPGNGFVPDVESLARALTEFCANEGFERPHVAGLSLGGWVALEMAKLGSVASVCAISPAGLWRSPLDPRGLGRQAIGRRLAPLVGPLMGVSRLRHAALSRQMVHPERVSRAEAAAMARGYIGSELYTEADRAMRAGVFEHRDLIEVPITIAWGAEDVVVGRPSRTRRPPEARYLEMAGWGHTPTWDDPEGVAKLILESSAG